MQRSQRGLVMLLKHHFEKAETCLLIDGNPNIICSGFVTSEPLLSTAGCSLLEISHKSAEPYANCFIVSRKCKYTQ